LISSDTEQCSGVTLNKKTTSILPTSSLAREAGKVPFPFLPHPVLPQLDPLLPQPNPVFFPKNLIYKSADRCCYKRFGGARRSSAMDPLQKEEIDFSILHLMDIL